MTDIDELIAILETEADAFANYGGAYDPDDYRLKVHTTLQEMRQRIAELELICTNYRLGGQHKQDDWLDLITENERLDAALAEIDSLPPGRVPHDVREITKKARAGE